MTSKNPRTAQRTLHHFLKIALLHKGMLAVNLIAPFFAIIIGDIGFRFFVAVLFGQLAKFQEVPAHDIWRTFFLLMTLVGVQVVLWRINDYTLLKRQAKTLRDLERYVFQKMQAHSYRFYSDNFAGSLVTQFSRFLKSYEFLEDTFFFEIFSATIFLVSAIVVLMFMAPILGVALLVWAVLFIGLITWLTVKKFPITRAATAADSKVTANIADTVTNMLNVKIFARNSFESRRFKATSQDRYEKRWRSWKYDAHIRNVRWIFVVVFLFLFLYLSVHLVTTGKIEVSVVLAAQLYIMQIYNQLFNLNRTIQRVELAFADAAEMTEILDLEPEVKDPKQPDPLRMKNGAIKFQDVSFKYADAGYDVMTDFSLTIPAGQKVGLVGHSGSGKSTLTRLLMRFADIQSGQISIDEQNIANVTQDNLRGSLAFVPQEPILFHRSLYENILYGREDATEQEVREAAKLAHAAEFIKDLPIGYETMVGERGVKLSGGEKQRVAIARAMLSRAPVLILDEATSALDSKSEKLITDALDKLMKNRTTIVVAHRLSTIRKMDRILVMKNGKIIEDGNHDSLLAKKGEYFELWSHQSGGFLDE